LEFRSRGRSFKINSISNNTIYTMTHRMNFASLQKKKSISTVPNNIISYQWRKNIKMEINHNRCHILHSVSFVVFVRTIDRPTDRPSFYIVYGESPQQCVGFDKWIFTCDIVHIYHCAICHRRNINEEQENRRRWDVGGGKNRKWYSMIFSHTGTV